MPYSHSLEWRKRRFILLLFSTVRMDVVYSVLNDAYYAGAKIVSDLRCALRNNNRKRIYVFE